MTAELTDIANFLEDVQGFEGLRDSERLALAAQLSVSYLRRGSTVLTAGDTNAFLYIIRSGAVELFLHGRDFSYAS